MDHTARLPAEILRDIFARVRRADPLLDVEGVIRLRFRERLGECSDPPRPLAHALLTWISSVTHVYSRWRTVAIHDPSLWMEIPTALGLDWSRTFVMRASSGGGPLMLDYGGADHNMRSWIYQSLIPVYYEIMGNLEVTVHPDLPVELLSTLDRSWPMLENLSLRYSRDHTTPDAILYHDFPHLRALNWGGAHSIAFPWRASGLKHLTRLTLSFAPGLQPAQVALFITALDAMPDLKELRINNEIDHTWPTGTSTCSACISELQVSNLRLDIIYWRADVNVIAHIMHHIFLPPTAKLWLEAVYHTNQAFNEVVGVGIRSICSQVRAWFQALPTSAPFLSAQTDWDSDLLQIHLSRSAAFPHKQDHPLHAVADRDLVSEETAPDFALNIRVSDDAYPFIVRTVLGELATHGLYALSICANQRVNPFAAVSTLSDPVFRNVQFLRLPSNRAGDYLSGLIASTEPVLLPELRLLAFGDTSRSSLVKLAAANVLKGFIAARYTAGARLQAVYIPEAEDMHTLPELDESTLTRIRETVAESESSEFPMHIPLMGRSVYVHARDLQGVPTQLYATKIRDDILKETEHVLAALRTLPEVVFISGEESALYEQDLWKETIGRRAAFEFSADGR